MNLEDTLRDELQRQAADLSLPDREPGRAVGPGARPPPEPPRGGRGDRRRRASWPWRSCPSSAATTATPVTP